MLIRPVTRSRAATSARCPPLTPFPTLHQAGLTRASPQGLRGMAEADEELPDAEQDADDDQDAVNAGQPVEDADTGAEVSAMAAVDDGMAEPAGEQDDDDGGGGDELSFDYSGDEMEDAEEVTQVKFGRQRMQPSMWAMVHARVLCTAVRRVHVSSGCSARSRRAD